MNSEDFVNALLEKNRHRDMAAFYVLGMVQAISQQALESLSPEAREDVQRSMYFASRMD